MEFLATLIVEVALIQDPLKTQIGFAITGNKSFPRMRFSPLARNITQSKLERNFNGN